MEFQERPEVRSKPWAPMYALAAVAILYWARPLLVPVALAILLTFVVAPLVTWIERWVHRRALSVSIATLLLIGTVGGLTVLVGQQFVGLVAELPTYRDTIIQKLEAIRAGPAGFMGRAADSLGEFSDDISHAVSDKKEAIQETKEAAEMMRDVKHGPSPYFGMQVEDNVVPHSAEPSR